ncbi:MAG: alpha/beta fold hydrolase [Tepidiformaceae bacterium]
MPTAAIDGTNIYYEIRGAGPPLLFICGAFADVSHFARVAELLADNFTTITYDRRGNSRSGGLRPGVPTGPDEQADDAMALLRTLDLAPAHIYGNSSGAIMALNLVLRHPDVVRAAILHEPPLNAGMERPEEVEAFLGNIVETGMAAGGESAAAEAFLRFAIGDTNWEALGREGQDRARSNATVFLGSELGNFESYSPGTAALKAVSRPVTVVVSDDGPPFFKEIGPWLAGELSAQFLTTPGTHAPQLDHPAELALLIRSILAGLEA